MKLQVAGVGKDVWSMGSKLSNSIFKPKKVEAETAASTPCEATTSHQVFVQHNHLKTLD